MKSKTATQLVNHLRAWRTALGLVVIVSLLQAGATSVNAQDSAGPIVTNQIPAVVASGGGPLNTIRVEFDEAVAPASFTPEDVTLYGPMGALISVTVSAVGGSGDTQFDLAFADQTVRGVYRLTVGPNVTDVAGNPMNQNGNAGNGEATDAYNGTVVYATEAVTIPYAQDFEVGDIDALAGWSFNSLNGTIAVVGTNAPHGGGYHLQMAGGNPSYTPRQAILKVDLTAQAGHTNLVLDFWFKRLVQSSVNNHLSLAVSGDGSNWVSMTGDLLSAVDQYVHYAYDLDEVLSNNAIAFDADVYVRFQHSAFYSTSVINLDDVRVLESTDLFGPKVTSQTPAVVASGGGPVDSIRLTFDEAIDPASFTPDHVRLYGPMGDLIPVTVSAVGGSGNTQFDLAFANQTVRGIYRLKVGPGITDTNGYPMNQDGDLGHGEPEDAYNGTVTFESSAPTMGTAPILLVESFESWPPVLGYWSFDSPALGTVSVVTNDGPKSGLQHLRLDPRSFNQSQWAMLKLDLSAHSGATNLFLEFWIRSQFNSANYGQTYLEVGGDGTNWRQVMSFDPPGSYQKYAIDLDAELAAGGVTFDTDVYIRWRILDQQSLSGSYYRIFLDEVRVTQGNPTLLLTVAPPTFPENSGSAAACVTVTQVNSTNVAESVVVALAGPTNVLVLPTSVTIAPNSNETNFLIGAVDDGVAAGDRQAAITASATGFADGTATVTLLEATPAQIGLTLSGSSASEAAGANALSGFVTRDRGLGTNLVVTLSSSDTTEIITPSSVTIPVGSTNAFFELDAQNDGDIDGTQTVTVTANAPEFATRSVNVEVTDDDTLSDRTLGGRISGTLSPAIYRVVANLSVSTGQTLTIAAGSQLLFSGGTTLAVAGSLIADGDAGSEILFTSGSVTPSAGDWAGLRIIGSGQPSSLDHVEIAFASSGLGLVAQNGSPHLTVSNCDIHDNAGNGIALSPTLDYNIISGNVRILQSRIHANGDSGIFLTSNAQDCDGSYSEPNIVGNEIYGNGAAGIKAWPEVDIDLACSPKVTSRVGGEISGNVIHHNPIGIDAFANRFLPEANICSFNAAIQNNLIVSNLSIGVRLDQNSNGRVYPKVVNNTIAYNGGPGMWHSGHIYSGFTLQNNAVVNNMEGIHADTAGFVPTNGVVAFNDVSGNTNANWINYAANFGDLTTTNRNETPADEFMNISVDPQFLAPGNFHLQSSSLCVNAGNSANAPASDFEGEPRGIADIGYDEVLFQPVLLSPVILADGQLRTTMLGEPGLAVTLQGTPDLFQWADLGSYVNQTGTLVITNAPPAGYNAYFYRTVFR
jgi:hypothetical protein